MALVREAAQRPLLRLSGGAIVPPDAGPQCEERIDSILPVLEAAAASVGRLEISGHPTLTWLGTGFLAGPGLVVTAGHVADVFVSTHDGGFALNGEYEMFFESVR